MPILFEDKTQLLHRCFFTVHNEVGLGRREEAYHQACRLCFQEMQLPIVSKQPHRLIVDDVEAHALYPDFVGWDCISIELKAIPRKLGLGDWVQLIDYMKFRGDRLGLLVNFGLDRVFVQRVIYEPPQTALIECWKRWDGLIDDAERKTGQLIRDAIHAVYSSHTTGYGAEVVSKLVQAALRNRRLALTYHPTGKAFYHDVEIHESALDCLIVDDRVLLVWTALFDSNAFNVSRGLSYMRALDLKWGVAVNFGKEQVEIAGLRRR